MDNTTGIFGPGFSTNWESQLTCDLDPCYDFKHPGMTLTQGDGSSTRFEWNPAISKWEALGGSGATMTVSGPLFAQNRVITFRDGSQMRFFHTGGSTFLFEVVDEVGRTTTMTPNAAGNAPGLVEDDASGRIIHFEYYTFANEQGNVVSKIYTGTPGTAAYREVNYTYTVSGSGSSETWWLDTVCEPAPTTGQYCQNYDWTAGGQLDKISGPSNGRLTDINYFSNGKVQEVLNNVAAPGDPASMVSTSFAYIAGGWSTVNDARSNTWTVNYNSFRYTTSLKDPYNNTTKYTYAEQRRSVIEDASTHKATLQYNSDGNLEWETNGEDDKTTYYYLDTDAPTKPSKICDSRSDAGTGDTYCTLIDYNADGEKLSEREPGETPAQAEEWKYSNGTELAYDAIGTETVPKGLLLQHRDGNTGAVGGEGVTDFEYAANGDLRRVSEPAGLVTVYDYDALGRLLTATETADGSAPYVVRTLTYDSNGRIATDTGPSVINTVTSSVHQMQVVNTWDGNGQLDRRVVADLDTPGSTRTWTFAQDAMDRVVAAEDPEAFADGPTGPAKAVRTTYDANGNPTSVTDANGNRVETSYDNRNLPDEVTAVAFDDGHGTPLANRLISDTDHYANGQVQSVTRHLSGTDWTKESYNYDNADRLETTILANYDNPSSSVTTESNTYDPDSGFLASTTVGVVGDLDLWDAAITSYGYDTAGRMSTVTTGTRETVTLYDPVGNPTQVTTTGSYVLGGVSENTVSQTRTTYSKAGLAVSVTIENGTEDLETTTEYNDYGLPVVVVSPRGNTAGAAAADHTTTMVYDHARQLISSTGPDVAFEQATAITNLATNWTTGTAGAAVTVGYDAFGNATHTQDPNANTTITTYDRNDRRTMVTHPTYTAPAGGTVTPYEEWGYDGNGNTISYRSRNAHVTTFGFDDANQPVTRTDPQIPTPDNSGMQTAGVAQTFYDYAGRVTSTISPEDSVTAVGYDERDRATSTTVIVRAVGAQPAQTAVTNMTYTGLGQVLTITDAEGVVTTNTYTDSFGQPATTRTGTLDASSFTYDGVGRILRATNPDGSYIDTTYDQAGRVLTTKRYGSDNSLAEQITNTWDDDSNLLTVTDARGGQTINTYDAAGKRSTVTQTVSLSDSITTEYHYDLAGNMTRLFDGEEHSTRYTYNVWNLPEITLEPSAVTSPAEPETDRRWTISYDDAGQTVHEAHPGGRVVTRAFNALGLPDVETSTETGAVTVGKTWGYDRDQRPVRLSHPTSPIVYTYDDRGLLVTQTGGAGDASFTYDEAGRPLTRTDEAGTRGFTYTGNGQTDTVYDGAPPAGNGRVAGSVAEYVFAGGTGSTVADVSNNGAPLDLTIANPGNTSWSSTGLSINTATKLETSGAATKINAAVASSGELTLEAWIDPANLTQNGPARIMSISSGAYLRNTTLGQEYDEINMRVRATNTTNNGIPMFQTSNSPLTTDLVHVVATHDSSGNEVIYADGAVQATTTGVGSITNWDNTYKLLIANETSNDRPWLGEICLAAIYDEALTAAEVAQNHSAGCPATGGSGGGSGAWSIDYSYDTAGRLTDTLYAGDGHTAIAYDTAGRVSAETIKDDTGATTASTAYHYDCVGQLIAKNTDLGTNTGDGLNAYTYDLAGRLTSWKQNAAAVPPTCPGSGGTPRVAGTVVEYMFAGQTGSTVQDTANNGTALNLTIANPANTTWSADGLSINTATTLSTAGPATKVANAINASDALTLEAWVTPANITQGGPARIITNSSGGYLRNTTLGQEGDEIDFRVRAANTSNNGYPTLRTTNDALATDLIHLVATHDAAGNQVIYADGAVQKTWNAGVINTFDTSYGLYVGNESTNDRAWLGEICLAAIYDKALTATEVDQNFAAGCAQTTGGGGESPPTGVIYTYDDVGNRVTAGTDSFTYDNRNRLTADPDGDYAWDPAGTLATYTPTSGPAETYTFDAAARLTAVTDGTANTTYGYDSLDRISTRGSAAFTYAGGELDPTSDGNDAFHRDPAGRLLAYDTGTAVTHAATDGHNDLYGLINPDGTISDTATYDPYGEPIATTGTTNPVLGYQSDFTDPATEHVWMGARWYQPSTATFLSRDTYAGELATPFTLNRYTYALNNPTRFWDPDGNRANVDGLGLPEKFRNQNKAANNVPAAVAQAEGDSYNPYPNYNTGTVNYDPPYVYNPESAAEQRHIAVAANDAHNYTVEVIVSSNVDKVVALVDQGLLPETVWDQADLSILYNLDTRIVAESLDMASSQYGSGYGGEISRAEAAFEILARASNEHRCSAGVGTCLQPEPMGDAMRGLLNVASLIPGIDTFADLALCADASLIQQDKVETGFNCGAVLVVGAGAGYTKIARESVDFAVGATRAGPGGAPSIYELTGVGDDLAQGGVYALRDPISGEIVRTGRSNNLTRRAGEHLRDPALADFDFEIVARTDVYAQQRGLEQLAHDAYTPALNRIRPISPINPNRVRYLGAADEFLSIYGGG